MIISLRNVSFGYATAITAALAKTTAIFEGLNADFDSEENGHPLVILGPSGCGKTTFLKLLGGLLKPDRGIINRSEHTEITRSTASGTADTSAHYTVPGEGLNKTAFMFQEPRLLPWLTVLDNVSLPLLKIFGRNSARERARLFLSMVSLDDKLKAYPKELSGGQAQRVSMARAFAWPAPALFMDEPFQSLDIPLRISLMDLTLSLLEKEKRLLVAVTHDPREAIYMGRRIIILGKPGQGIIFDRKIDLSYKDRAYGSIKSEELEYEIRKVLKS